MHIKKHFNKENTTGKLIRANWESISQQVGINGRTDEWNWESIEEYLQQKT